MLPANEYQILLSNLAFNWLDPANFIPLMRQLLVPAGVCYFSAYGPQTASHSRALLANLDRHPHFNDYYALQDIGDALSDAGFQEIVVETYSFELEYQAVDALLKDAVTVFGVNLHPDRRKSLSPKDLLHEFGRQIEQIILEEGKFIETVEVLLAHARTPPAGQIPVSVA